MNNQFIVRNNGSEISETNYWETDFSKKGFLYLSMNAGAFRLLLSHEIRLTGQGYQTRDDFIKEIKDAEYVIISRGFWDKCMGEALEVLFEDNTDYPYILHLSPGQFDRIPSKEDNGRTFKISLWKDGPNKILEKPARYRHVKFLPYMKPWGK